MNLSKKIVGFSFVDIPGVGRGENKTNKQTGITDCYSN